MIFFMKKGLKIALQESKEGKVEKIMIGSFSSFSFSLTLYFTPLRVLLTFGLHSDRVGLERAVNKNTIPLL